MAELADVTAFPVPVRGCRLGVSSVMAIQYTVLAFDVAYSTQDIMYNSLFWRIEDCFNNDCSRRIEDCFNNDCSKYSSSISWNFDIGRYPIEDTDEELQFTGITFVADGMRATDPNRLECKYDDRILFGSELEIYRDVCPWYLKAKRTQADYRQIGGCREIMVLAPNDSVAAAQGDNIILYDMLRHYSIPDLHGGDLAIADSLGLLSCPDSQELVNSAAKLIDKVIGLKDYCVLVPQTRYASKYGMYGIQPFLSVVVGIRFELNENSSSISEMSPLVNTSTTINIDTSKIQLGEINPGTWINHTKSRISCDTSNSSNINLGGYSDPYNSQWFVYKTGQNKPYTCPTKINGIMYNLMQHKSWESKCDRFDKQTCLYFAACMLVSPNGCVSYAGHINDGQHRLRFTNNGDAFTFSLFVWTVPLLGAVLLFCIFAAAYTCSAVVTKLKGRKARTPRKGSKSCDSTRRERQVHILEGLGIPVQEQSYYNWEKSDSVDTTTRVDQCASRGGCRSQRHDFGAFAPINESQYLRRAVHRLNVCESETAENDWNDDERFSEPTS